MSSRGADRDGFTLMEVLLSLGIMTIALISLVAVLVTGLRANSHSLSRGDAQDFAFQVMGRTLSEIEALTDGRAQRFWEEDQSSTPWATGVEKRNSTSYDYEIRCYQVRGAGGNKAMAGDRNQLKKITVKVEWRDTASGADVQTLTIARLLNREI